MHVRPAVYLCAFPSVQLWQLLYISYTELHGVNTEKQLTCIKKK
jgi:hypothetical protein